MLHKNQNKTLKSSVQVADDSKQAAVRGACEQRQEEEEEEGRKKKITWMVGR